MSVLEAIALTKEFSRRGAVFAAVREAAFALDAGCLAVLTGASGSGKTTLLTMLAGLQRPTSGRVLVLGRGLFTLTDAELSLLRNRSLSYIPQGASLLPALSVIDNTRLPLYLNVGGGDGEGRARGLLEEADAERHAGGKSGGEGRARELLEEAGVAHLAAAYPRELSGGEARRVAVARALVNRPEVVLADEPTADLDAESAAAVMRMLSRAASEGACVLAASHDPVSLRYAARSFTMTEGVLGEENHNE